ncbi:hypothetical protein V492_03856 [Pseudogymnoascus sp. VKM F-4246]|nr:hypothetical protein V492_03856 [Pseudogymnoascus sp. VKM F-4246]
MFVSQCVIFGCLFTALYTLTLSIIASTNGKPRPYSAWMADSVIMRQEVTWNSATKSDVSAHLKIGLFQHAIFELKDHYGYSQSVGAQEDWEAYLKESVDSAIDAFLDVGRDDSDIVNMFSMGKSILYRSRVPRPDIWYIAMTDSLRRYHHSQNRMYLSALEAMRKSLNTLPRNTDGGIPYFVSDPDIMALDETYPLVSFYALYPPILEPDNRTIAKDIVNQLDIMWSHCCQNGTHLCVHGYDAAMSSPWANTVSGASPYVFARAVGWYLLGLLQLLDISNTTGILSPSQWTHTRQRFIDLANAAVDHVDADTGCWWQIMDYGGHQGNFVESSASAMLVYALLKGRRLGYLSRLESKGRSYDYTAKKCYRHIMKTFLISYPNGSLGLDGTVDFCAIYDDPSYEYYTGRPIVTNHVYGTAPFILASLEYERR